ncbi:MAG: archease [Chloroflexota bacterium]
MPDQDFEIVEHTADWAIRVYGRDLRHLLLNAARGMTSLMAADLEAIPLDTERSLEWEAFDDETLLVDWLSELAYLAESEGLVFRDYALAEVAPRHWRAVVRGGPAAELQKHIKAVTYHNLEITKTAEGLQVTVVLDA